MSKNKLFNDLEITSSKSTTPIRDSKKKDIDISMTQEYNPRPRKIPKKSFVINSLEKTTIKDFKKLAAEKRLSHTKLLRYLIDKATAEK